MKHTLLFMIFCRMSSSTVWRMRQCPPGCRSSTNTPRPQCTWPTQAPQFLPTRLGILLRLGRDFVLGTSISNPRTTYSQMLSQALFVAAYRTITWHRAATIQTMSCHPEMDPETARPKPGIRTPQAPTTHPWTCMQIAQVMNLLTENSAVNPSSNWLQFPMEKEQESWKKKGLLTRTQKKARCVPRIGVLQKEICLKEREEIKLRGLSHIFSLFWVVYTYKRCKVCCLSGSVNLSVIVVDDFYFYFYFLLFIFVYFSISIMWLFGDVILIIIIIIRVIWLKRMK